MVVDTTTGEEVCLTPKAAYGQTSPELDKDVRWMCSECMYGQPWHLPLKWAMEHFRKWSGEIIKLDGEWHCPLSNWSAGSKCLPQGSAVFHLDMLEEEQVTHCGLSRRNSNIDFKLDARWNINHESNTMHSLINFRPYNKNNGQFDYI